MANQLRLFPREKPSTRQIREIVRAELHGFELRQKARDQKRKAKNEQLREEVRRLKRRIPV